MLKLRLCFRVVTHVQWCLGLLSSLVPFESRALSFLGWLLTAPLGVATVLVNVLFCWVVPWIWWDCKVLAPSPDGEYHP